MTQPYVLQPTLTYVPLSTFSVDLLGWEWSLRYGPPARPSSNDGKVHEGDKTISTTNPLESHGIGGGETALQAIQRLLHPHLIRAT